MTRFLTPLLLVLGLTACAAPATLPENFDSSFAY
ncbi:hypothetical protein SAMN05444339_101777 [Loktanella atrilutea]|uniref:Uncharacterized protein n=1 Tax=Loktanella atrilutea TaxID=366533 RepID=A0A1M4ULH7_LOKAT|nr:hypothetical protein SAMN05444339_101777 [Loktanella atrilutea]